MQSVLETPEIASAAQVHLMHQAFRPYHERFVLVFLDDILLYSKTLAEPEQHVRTVLEVLLSQIHSRLYCAGRKDNASARR